MEWTTIIFYFWFDIKSSSFFYLLHPSLLHLFFCDDWIFLVSVFMFWYITSCTEWASISLHVGLSFLLCKLTGSSKLCFLSSVGILTPSNSQLQKSMKCYAKYLVINSVITISKFCIQWVRKFICTVSTYKLT